MLSYVTGWLLFFTFLGCLALAVPADVFVPGSEKFIFLIGMVGAWRYGVGFVHFIRGMIFLKWVFPRVRRKAMALGDTLDPSHVYLMVTSFRIDAKSTAEVYDSILSEAISCGWPSTVVCSVVELSDENIMRGLWAKRSPPNRVKLKMVRIPGTGKRDGLAYGFRAISRDMPDENAIVAVIDGDTVLEPGVVRETAPYFKLSPKLGALTTNEFCEVRGTYVMSEWHKLRFAQRHINMCSMALSNRVLTLTGRMSVFRAAVVTNPMFIADVEHDNLKHWRLGQFKFLTGDDKSSWFSLMRLGYDTWYVPSAAINTIEYPPDPNFFRASRKLMFRWYGNNLRQNSRATKLGISKLGLFTYYIVWDQRISMWTSIFGLLSAFLASIKYSFGYLMIYILWIMMTRTILTFLLLASGHRIGPAYPLLLYYNQILGSLMKIFVVFRLDQQSWTRQNTKVNHGHSRFQSWFNPWSARIFTFSSASLFVALVYSLI